MLADRLETTLEAARDELAALDLERGQKKVALKKKLTADLEAVDAQYRREAAKLRALVRAFEVQESEPEQPKPEPPAEKKPGTAK